MARAGHCYLGDEVRVADDGSDEKAVVGDLSALLDAGSPEVQVHLMVSTGYSGQGEVPHTAQLQLEGQSWLQVPVDLILLELHTHTKSHKRLDTNMAYGRRLQFFDNFSSFTSSLARNVKNLGNSLYTVRK